MSKSSVTIEEAVELGYGSRSTLNRRIRDGRLPSVKINNKRYFEIRDLEALRNERRIDERDLFNQAVRFVASQAPKFTDDQIDVLVEILNAGR